MLILATSFIIGWTKNCDVLLRQWLDIHYVFVEAKQWPASVQFIKHCFRAWCYREASVKTWGKSFHSCLSLTAYRQLHLRYLFWHYVRVFSPTSCKQTLPEKFIETLKLMEHRYGAKDFETNKDTSLLPPGTFYLTHVDSMYRRFYDQKPVEETAGGKAKCCNGFANGH